VVRGRRFLAGTTDPIEKSTSVTVACRPVAALFSLASLISSDAGCSKDRRNGLACNALVPRTHSHHSDEVHFECEIFHQNTGAI